MNYPNDLTTSDWLDFIGSLATRDEQIAAMATFQRRVEYEAKQSILGQIADPDPVANEVLQKSLSQAAQALPSLGDYVSGADVVSVPVQSPTQLSPSPLAVKQ